MRGSTRRRGSKWSYYFDAYDPVTTKRQQVTKSGFQTKKAAEEALRAALGDFDFAATSGSTVLVSMASAHWLELRRIAVSPAMSTLETNAFTHWWLPHLGKCRVDQVTVDHLQRVVSEEMVDLAPATIKSYLAALSRFYSWAIKSGYVSANPTVDVVRPRDQRRDLSVISAELVRQVIEAFSDHALFVPVVLAAATGMRRGEVLGLRWSDIDFGAGSISIMRTLGKHGIQPPKTAGSRRRIAIGPGVVSLLRDELDRQEKLRAELGSEWNAEGWVCASEVGTARDPDNVSHRFVKRIRAAGLPKITFHDLRHAHATQLLREGEHPRIVSERLGHSSIAVTLDVYSHVLPDMQQSAADKADAWLGVKARDPITPANHLSGATKPRR